MIRYRKQERKRNRECSQHFFLFCRRQPREDAYQITCTPRRSRPLWQKKKSSILQLNAHNTKHEEQTKKMQCQQAGRPPCAPTRRCWLVSSALVRWPLLFSPLFHCSTSSWSITRISNTYNFAQPWKVVENNSKEVERAFFFLSVLFLDNALLSLFFSQYSSSRKLPGERRQTNKKKNSRELKKRRPFFLKKRKHKKKKKGAWMSDEICLFFFFFPTYLQLWQASLLLTTFFFFFSLSSLPLFFFSLCCITLSGRLTFYHKQAKHASLK